MTARLYGILDFSYTDPSQALPVAEKLLRGGVGILQLRAKTYAPAALLAPARELASLCRRYGVPFIINDHPELARDSDADGVHVGQDDLSVARAREILGPGRIVGKSTHSPVQAHAAFAEHPDYIGFGPLFATPTKPDYQPVGLDDIRQVVGGAPLPVFCIGGIKPGNLHRVLSAGADRVVIVSGLLLAEEIEATCRDCLRLLTSEITV